MHPKLASLQKRLGQPKTPEPAPAGDAGLGEAIRALVQQQVAEAMAEQQAQAQADRKMKKIFAPEPASPGPVAPGPAPAAPGPAPATPAPAPQPKALDMQVHRDGAGLARSVTMCGQLYRIHRTADGFISKLTPDDGATK